MKPDTTKVKVTYKATFKNKAPHPEKTKFKLEISSFAGSQEAIPEVPSPKERKSSEGGSPK